MELRKWVSSDPLLEEKLHKTETTYNQDVSYSVENVHKVLGVQWDRRKDFFITDLLELFPKLDDITLTKQNVLRFKTSIFSLGDSITNCDMFKLFMQKVSTLPGQWDDILSKTLVNNSIFLIKLLDIGLSVPRYYFVDKDLLHVKNVTIHDFCDAIQDSYAAVIYNPVITNQNNIK